MKDDKRIRIRPEGGASLVFVLCIMLLFMLIGTSTLVAASTAAGGNVGQRSYKQLSLYAQSLTKTLTRALESSGFGREFVAAAYRNKLPTVLSANWEDIAADIEVEDMRLEYPYLSVRITPEVPDMSGYDDANGNGQWDEGETEWSSPRVPEMATVDFNLNVITTIRLEDGTMTLYAQYEARGGYLEDGNINKNATWRLISYENSKN